MKGRLRETVDWRVSLTAGAGALVGVGTVLLGMEPRLVLVGVIVVLVSASTWLVVDMRNAVSSITWHERPTGSVGSAVPDRRVQVLRSRLRMSASSRRVSRPTDPRAPESTDEIASTLLDTIDDRLMTDHGLDRASDPEAAAVVLGADLSRFVSDPVARRSMTRQRRLAHTLTLIEEL